jgi:hypothetical protein
MGFIKSSPLKRKAKIKYQKAKLRKQSWDFCPEMLALLGYYAKLLTWWVRILPNNACKSRKI